MLIVHLAQNIALLVSLSFLHGLIMQRFPVRQKLGAVVSGILFGCVALIGMLVPLRWESGIIFDGRSIVLCIAGLFGGPVAASIAAMMAAIYRLWLGGAGTAMGISVIFESAALGVVFFYLRRKFPDILTNLNLYLLGLMVHLIMVLLMFTLPQASTVIAFQKIALPVLLVYPPAVVLVALLFIQNESIIQNDLQLRTSEEKNRLFFEQAAVGIAEVAPDGRFLNPNKRFCEITGYDRHELQQLNFRDITHPDDLHLDEKYITEVFAGKRDTFDIEKRYIHKDGHPVWIHLYSNVIRDNKGEPLYAVASIIDIGDRRKFEAELRNGYRATQNLLEDLSREIDERTKAEKAISASEAKFREIFEFAGEGIIYVNPEGKIVEVNDALIKIFDMDRKDIIGVNVLQIAGDLLSIKDAKRVMPLIKKAISGQEIQNFEINFRGKILEVGAAHSKKSGFTTGLIRNITERKQMENKIRQSEQQYRLLFDEMLDAFALHEMIFDKKGNPVDYRFISVNTAFEKLTGLKGKDIIGKTILEVVPKIEQYWIETYGKVVKTGKPAHFENYARELDKYYEGIAYSPEKGKFATVFRDTTDKRKADEDIRFQALLLSQIHDSVVATDLDGKIIYINNAACKSLNRKESELIGSKIDLFGENPEGISQSQVLKTVLEKGHWEGEITHYDRSGNPVFWSSRIRTIKDDNDKPTGLVGISTNITETKEIIKKLEQSEKQLRALAGHLQSVREDERKAIAREIHDDVAQILTALKIDINIFAADLKTRFPDFIEQYDDNVTAIYEMIDDSIRKIRSLIRRLRPEILDAMNLIEVMRSYLHDHTDMHGINGKFRSYVDSLELGPDRNLALFRIFQEALTNIFRHANAKNIFASVSKKESGIILKIKDDGIGIAPEKIGKPDSFGITGMQERAVFLGGTIKISGKKKKGTEVILKIPA